MLPGEDQEQALLYKAIHAGTFEQIQDWFGGLEAQKRVDLLTKERDGELPLHCAVRRGYLKTLQLLISHDLMGKHLTEYRKASAGHRRGWSCLHLAADYGHLDIVQWLVTSCEDNVNLEDDEQNTPLHLAVLAGHKDVVHYLVLEAASLLVLNQKGMMPISYCKDHLMFEALVSPASFSAAAAVPATSSSQKRVDAENRTILHYAAQFSKKSDVIFKLITNNKECLKQEDSQQGTFLHVAAKFGNVEVLQALKNLGSDLRDSIEELLQVRAVSVDAPIRTSPGMYALLHNQMEFFNELITFDKLNVITLGCIVKVLLAELSHDSNIIKNFGLFASTLPTYLALYAKKEGIFRFLLETKTVSLCQWDEKYKRTCLHWAIVHGRADIVDKLCSHDQLQLGMQDIHGKTALHHAFESKNYGLMEKLRAYPGLKEHEQKLFRDRQVYVQALNAILVSASLIASITFAGWLQLPSDARSDTLPLKIFWASNSSSFFTAVATMGVTIFALLPTPNKYEGDIVNQMRLAIVIDALLLTFTLTAATVAFAASGFAASTLQSHSRIYLLIMWITAAAGIFLCLITWIAIVVQLYMCTLSLSTIYAIALQPFSHAADHHQQWPASTIRRMQARIGRSSRFSHSSKKKDELKEYMNRNLLEDHPARKLQQEVTAVAQKASSKGDPDSMKDQLEGLKIEGMDDFIDTIYKTDTGNRKPAGGGSTESSITSLKPYSASRGLVSPGRAVSWRNDVDDNSAGKSVRGKNVG